MVDDSYKVTRESMLEQSALSLRVGLALLRQARDIPGNHPDGRDLSIAVQATENAILRIEHGTPLDSRGHGT